MKKEVDPSRIKPDKCARAKYLMGATPMKMATPLGGAALDHNGEQ